MLMSVRLKRMTVIQTRCAQTPGAHTSVDVTVVLQEMVGSVFQVS